MERSCTRLEILKVDMENEIIKGCLVTHEGNIIHEVTKKLIEGET